MALGFGRFNRLVSLCLKLRAERHRERLIDGAWVAFQLSGSGQTFGEYLDAVGLGEKPRQTTEETVTAKEAIAKAEAILERARERI
jgi:hypothetical protein